MSDINIAKEKLIREKKSLVAVRDKVQIYSSDDRGIKPIYHLVVEKEERNMAIADKVIGKGAALLCIEGKVTEVYGELMSKSAIDLLEENNIAYSYKNTCDNILNRDKTGLCPIENLAVNSENLDDFKLKLRTFLKIN